MGLNFLIHNFQPLSLSLCKTEEKWERSGREKSAPFFCSHHRHGLVFGLSKGRDFFTMCIIKLVGFAEVPNAENK